MGNPTYFKGAADTARVSGASFDNGMNPGASNAPGIGVNIGGGELPPNTGFNGVGMNWTLLDQDEAARAPQVSQVIGGNGIVPRTGNVATTWDTTKALYSKVGAASSGGDAGKGTASLNIGSNADNITVNGNVVPDPVGVVANDGDATLESLAGGWGDAPVPDPIP